MRRHMEGMRGRGSNIAEFACRRKPTICQRREVITVNEVMERARMFWLRNKHFLENRSSLKLPGVVLRSEEHTSELQSLTNLVCRLLLAKKNTMEYMGMLN